MTATTSIPRRNSTASQHLHLCNLTDQGETMANPLSSQSSLSLPQGMEITAEIKPGYESILTREALELVAALHRTFEPRRQQLLQARVERTKRLDAGERPDFLAETKSVREGDWKIAPLPQDLQCRRVEITGPVERKMIINALNSGADSYMTDFEDSNAPSWDNQITGHINLKDAVRRTISLEQNGKSYTLNDKVATLIVRPRGWHLDEKHVTGGRQARLGRHLRFRALHGSQRQGTGRARHGALLLSAEDGEPSGSAVVERHFPRRTGSRRRAARHDPRDRADRNDRRRVRNGRDPVRAART
jgi:Malate synthase